MLIAAGEDRGEWLKSVLHADADLRVVGLARTPAETVPLTIELQPRVLVIDIDFDGDVIGIIERVMQQCPTPVVTFLGPKVEQAVTAHSRSEQSRCVQALSAGALSVVRHADQAASVVKEMSAIRVAARPPVWLADGARTRSAARTLEAAVPRQAPIGRIVAIACSVGGPGALGHIVSSLPATFPVPILVVQHLAEGFIGGLAEWLATRGPLRVKVAEEDEALCAGCVYLAPHDRHLTVGGGNRIVLSDAPPVDGFRPAATVLYESVARQFGDTAIAVMLTGLGNDGVDGLRHIRGAGGRILVQDAETAIAFSMPGAAMDAGLYDLVVPISAIAAQLEELIE